MQKLVDRLSMKAVRRLVIAVIGSTVILLGIVLSLPLVPGPGFVAILAGLAILATEFVWARTLLRKVRERVRSTVDAVKSRGATPPPAPEESRSGDAS
jgi:uncharacterized protein (TIGR02611 family)